MDMYDLRLRLPSMNQGPAGIIFGSLSDGAVCFGEKQLGYIVDLVGQTSR